MVTLIIPALHAIAVLVECSLPIYHIQINTCTVKFLNFRTQEKCCNLPKIPVKRPNFRVFRQKDANGIANSEDPDQTAPLGAD